jgi:hypothetical protein
MAPLGLQGRFVRYFGEDESARLGRTINIPAQKLAPKEREMRESYLQDAGIAANGTEVRLLLCSLAGEEVIWPSSMCLIASPAGLKADEDTKDCANAEVNTSRRKRYARPTSRSLLPPAKRYEEIADRTCAFIEKITQERERDRRERAEKAIADSPSSAGNTALASRAAGPSPPQGHGASPAFQASPSLFSTTSSATPAANPEMAFSPAQVSLHHDVHAKEATIAANSDEASTNQTSTVKKAPSSWKARMSLSEIKALLPPIPPSMLEERRKAAKAAAGRPSDSSKEVQHDVANAASTAHQVYPTPQSVSTAPDQASVLPATLKPSNSETFDEFIWGSSGGGMESSFSYGMDGGGKDDYLSFDHDMGGMFDMGVTDEDFSFFDEPAPAPVPAAAPIAQAQHDDLAFITSQGPVDHFSHLMPTGDSPASMLNHSTTSGTSPAFLLADIPTPASQQAMPVAGKSLTSPASHGALSVLPATSPSLAIVQPPNATHAFNTIQEIPAEQEKSVIPPQLPRYSMSTNIPGRIIRNLPSAYIPLSLVSSSQQSKCGNIVMTRGPHTSVDHLDLVANYRESKAARLRSQLLQRKQGAKKPLEQEKRNWQSAPDSSPGSMIFDSETSSSSDESASEEEYSWKKPSTKSGAAQATAEKGQQESLDKLVQLSASLVALRVSGLEVVLDSPKTGQVGPQTSDQASDEVKSSTRNKNEKEALATVFSLQYLENVNLRERTNATSLCKDPSFSRQRAPSAILPAPLPLIRLSDLQETFITVFRHSAVMKLSVPSLQFWQKLGLQPHSPPKDVRAMMLLPSSLADTAVSSAAEYWLARVGQAYKVRPHRPAIESC